MSFKLVDKIKKSNLPGTLKKVLEAYISFGNKDGTSIRPTAAAVAGRAGCSESTVWRRTPTLVRLGLLVHDLTEDGTYRTYNYPGDGVWAYVYHANLSPLNNPAIAEGFEMKRLAISAARSKARSKRKGSSQFVLFDDNNMTGTASYQIEGNGFLSICRTDQTLELDPSAVSTADSEKVREESPSLAPLATAPTAPVGKQDQPLQTLGSLPEPVHPKALELLHAISPNLSERKRREYLRIASETLEALPEDIDAFDLLSWNRCHRSGEFVSKADKALRIRTVPQFLKAVTGEEGWMLNEYDTHDWSGCPVCRDRNLRHSRLRLQEERRKAAEEAAEQAEAEDRRRWNAYPWRTQRTPEHTATFRANCQFDRAEAQKYWADRGGLARCRDAAVVYFAEQNVPFTREEFDWVMEDLHAGNKYHQTRLGY